MLMFYHIGPLGPKRLSASNAFCRIRPAFHIIYLKRNPKTLASRTMM